MSSAAVSAAFRPTTAEPTSSSRPLSSSALVCLITMKMLISPAPSAANPPYRQAVSEPSELPYNGPYSESSAGLCPAVAANTARPATVGYSFLKLYAVPQTRAVRT